MLPTPLMPKAEWWRPRWLSDCLEAMMSMLSKTFREKVGRASSSGQKSVYPLNAGKKKTDELQSIISSSLLTPGASV